MKKIIISFCMLFFVNGIVLGQTAEELLTKVAEKNKGVDEKIRIDVSGLSVYELLTTIAEEHRLNVSVDPTLNQLVVSNFYDVTVKDVIMFLVGKYELEMTFSNNILSFKKKEKLPPPKKVFREKDLDIKYNNATDFLSLKLKNDSLPKVTEKITELSGKNIVLDNNVKNNTVSAFLINKPFDQVLAMMAQSNDMVMEKDEHGFFILKKTTQNNGASNNTNRNNSRSRRQSSNQRARSSNDFKLTLQENGYISVNAIETPIEEIIITAAETLGLNYLFYDKLGAETVTMQVKDIDFENLLQHLFKGKKYGYKKIDDIYAIGLQTTEGLRYSELIQLERRTLDQVLATLPSGVVQNLEIKEFNELNGFLVSGSKPLVEELKTILRKLDQTVPLIQIEVIIAQYQKSHSIQTGLQALLDSEEGPQIQTGGVLFPTNNVTLNATSVNRLIDAFNGLGVVKLGEVTRDFYATLSLLENNSLLHMESTPKIATLSGHEASVSIGQTDYYFEQTNRLINTGVNDNILQSGQFRPTEANLSVNIKPTVSKDEHITLEIAVEQSSFLARVAENAPPGRATRRLESLVRVKNNEMILLGGLDELEKENSGTGTPILSRIPIIKWFFSGRNKRKEKSKLHVFIKPTLVY